MSVVDQRGLRLAREFRAALRAREEDLDLQAAIEVYDRAVTPDERQAAASYLLIHTTEADNRYNRETLDAFMKLAPRELRRPEEPKG